ncbi:NADH-quinone oxidoreductase subunit C [Candidatus Zixiibacteriota bacterium]|nr:NADH-quinone oxidoreductase subunit C [candidate division Zixibacteria bacterium]
MEDKVREFIKSHSAEGVIAEDNFRGQQSFYIKKEFLFDLCAALKSDGEMGFELLADICSLDWKGDIEEAKGRFEVIYNLYSLRNKYRLLIKVRLPEDDVKIDTLCPLWQTANWLEREVFDMMGIIFVGHPDLTKIVTPDELDGHPLCKDFPLTYEIPRFSYNKNEPPEVIK